MPIKRTTYHARMGTLMAQTSRIGREMAEVQRRAASGLTLEKPSDDPTSVLRLHRVKAQVEDQSVWTDNAEYAYSLLAVTDDALQSLGDVFSSARELAVMMASETYNDEQRSLASVEADGYFDEVLDLLNSHLGGRYVFAGTAYDNEAFDSTGTYQGDSGAPEIKIGETLTVEVGFDGNVDILSTIDALRTALESGDADQVQATLGDLESVSSAVSQFRSEVGIHMKKAEDALELHEMLHVDLASHLSDLQDADMMETYTRLTEVQTAYEAALQVLAGTSSTPLISRI